VPDELDKSKDRGNALLEEVQELVENLFHGSPRSDERCLTPAKPWMGL
jgi:hypothetical protein